MAIFVTWRFINFSLQAEKAKQLLYQAKYGRFGLGDPFHAMQRDSDSQKDNSFDEAAVKAMYDNQLMQLENLIATQRKAQQRMREQLAAVEKRYHKVKKSIIYVGCHILKFYENVVMTPKISNYKNATLY